MISYGTRWRSYYWNTVMNLFLMNMMMTTIWICNSMVHMMTIKWMMNLKMRWSRMNRYG